MSSPETEVVSCPACNHLLRVPLDWLGQPVQCPECKAKFKAPTRNGTGGLTAAELISRPTPTAAPELKGPDAALWLPAFGLMLLGVIDIVANAGLGYRFLSDAAGAKEYVRGQLASMRQYGFGAEDLPEDRDRLEEERAERTVRLLRWIVPAAGVAALLAFLGGLSITLRRNRTLAQVGCVAAALNVVGLCCVPGAAVGLWGLLMLHSEEGRAHFRR